MKVERRVWRRVAASILAIVLTVWPVLAEWPVLTVLAGNAVIYQQGQNLLDGKGFSFYGKVHERRGLWHWIDENGRALFCLDPNAGMRSGAKATKKTYNIYQDELPYGLTAEEAKLMYWAQKGCGNTADNPAKESAAQYIMSQSLIWALLSGEWEDEEKFYSQMESVIAGRMKNKAAASEMLGALDTFMLNAYVSGDINMLIPDYLSDNPYEPKRHDMILQPDGTYAATIAIDTNALDSKFLWMHIYLLFDMPEGWDYQYAEDYSSITFTCRTGNPESGIIKAHFAEDSPAYLMKYPETITIYEPDRAPDQPLLALGGEVEPWELYLQFGGDTPCVKDGGFEVEVNTYEHEEVFLSNYLMKLQKLDYETAQSLENSAWEILEYFDYGQLDGGVLEEERLSKVNGSRRGPLPSQWEVCCELITDKDGCLEHGDQFRYDFYKTYCGGHPDPQITYIEQSEEPEEEDNEAHERWEEENTVVEERNADLERQAWEAWALAVEKCEEVCNFHSIVEGEASKACEDLRDQVWEEFLELEYQYTAREVRARDGYILHGIHGDDVAVETVSFSSSQTEGKGEPKGASISVPDRNLVRASWVSLGSASDAELDSGTDENERNIFPASDSNAQILLSPIAMKKWSLLDWEDGEGTEQTASGGILWNGRLWDYASGDDSVTESFGKSEIGMINQGDYPGNHLGYTFVVYDHRTEGQLHINKRDKELYEEDDSDNKEQSSGQSQGDATLEGAVYGLFAAEDIIHPDGKSGKVFSEGELVSIAATDKNGDASFLAITEVSETSEVVSNLYTMDGTTEDGRIYSDNRRNNGNVWIGRPLLLGKYYVKEISRSEGYELSVTGIHLKESNRTAPVQILAKSGTAAVRDYGKAEPDWDGTYLPFFVEYYNTKGYDVMVSGYPANTRFYKISMVPKTIVNKVYDSQETVYRLDDSGNKVPVLAEGGEYKLDRWGRKILMFDEDGMPVYSDKPAEEIVVPIARSSVYPKDEVEAEDTERFHSTDIDTAYMEEELVRMMNRLGYRSGLGDDAPWMTFQVDGNTNGEIITAILEEFRKNDFWDAYRIDSIEGQEQGYLVTARYGYLAKDSYSYVDGAGKLIVKKQLVQGTGYYYLTYEPGEYEKQKNSYRISKLEAEEPVVYGEEYHISPVYDQLYECYAKGEQKYNQDGELMYEMETIIHFREVTEEYEEEIREEIPASYDSESGEFKIAVDTSDIEWNPEAGGKKQLYYAQVPGMDRDWYLERLMQSGIFAWSQKEEVVQGSYLVHALLLYPGQEHIWQDADTQDLPIIVQQRVIKQAIRVTKDIAQESYGDNTYKLHRDPFTVLFGGYGGGEEAKTLKGFKFKLYRQKDLDQTGLLENDEDNKRWYQKFFAAMSVAEEGTEEAIDQFALDYSLTRKDAEEYAAKFFGLDHRLSIEWDRPDYDVDRDLTTIHANRGGGKDDYWGTSIMLPYGTYVIVEQQPDGMPNKSYKIQAPREVTLPFIPDVGEDGGVSDQVPDKKYLYDYTMTPEAMVENFHIRFHEETHMIKAHNQDGDFLVFKYGLEPDIARNCGNDVVESYYKYGSISENAGVMDHVYYDTYIGRDGEILDYGVTLDGVATMTGISTAIDRKFASALVPWSVLDPRYGEIINDDGDIGNREPGKDDDGEFNFISFAHEDFENSFYSSKLRFEKKDSETQENIIHEGAYFKIYAAKRDVVGNGQLGVGGTGDVLWNEDGTPQYDEAEQIIMVDHTGAEVGIFKAYSTIRDGYEDEDGNVVTDKTCVGYIETYQPLGSGVYVLVEVEAPPGYVKSAPIAFEIYSNQVGYYKYGNKGEKTEAMRYKYLDGEKTVDVARMEVENNPTRIEIKKLEAGSDEITYRVYGDENQLKARGDVTLYYKPNGDFAGYGEVTRVLDDWKDEIFVPRATLTLYQGLAVKRTGNHEYEGITVKRNWNDSVTEITAETTGSIVDIRKTGINQEGNDIWDITEESGPSANVWRYDLQIDPLEWDWETGILYGLDDRGNRICLVDSETGMAYTEDEKGQVIVWILNEWGEKVVVRQIEKHTDESGRTSIYNDLKPVLDQNGLPIYYQAGQVNSSDCEWQTPLNGGYQIDRIAAGAYVLEETVVPSSLGYVQAQAVGMVVEETEELQIFIMKEDYTKVEISKIDAITGEAVPGAVLTLYEAKRVPDCTDRGWHLEKLMTSSGEPRIYRQWISGEKPVWMDHVPFGDYILEETEVPENGGYVTAVSMEVIIRETGEVQCFVMKDDYTAAEFLKKDASTGGALSNDNPAILALYRAGIDEEGTPFFDETQKLFSWQTDDGKAVMDTAYEVTIPGGHTYIAYRYDKKPIPEIPGAIGYVTETGAFRIDYLPMGQYYLAEESAPVGMSKAEPVYVRIMDVGSLERIQLFTMTDFPLMAEVTKTNITGGKEIFGARLSVYRAKEDGSIPKVQMIDQYGEPVYETDADGVELRDEDGKPIPKYEYLLSYHYESWISGTNGRYTMEDEVGGHIPEGFSAGDLKPYILKRIPAGNYYLIEKAAPYGYVRAEEVAFSVENGNVCGKLELVNHLLYGRLEILKYAEEEGEPPLEGAKFKFTNLDTKETVIMITGEDGRVISDYVPIGSVGVDGVVQPYRFMIEEIETPDGFELDGTQRVFSFPVSQDNITRITHTYRVPNKRISVKISKVDITNQQELPGAALEVRDMEGNLIDSWISDGSVHEITGSLTAGKSYTLTETFAPDGFTVAEQIQFTIKADGTVETVKMENRPTHAVIRKTDIVNGEELPGAYLTLKDMEGNLIAEWVSTETPYEIVGVLKAGETYILHEVSAPVGYECAEDVIFTVGMDGKIDRVIMEDGRKEPETTPTEPETTPTEPETTPTEPETPPTEPETFPPTEPETPPTEPETTPSEPETRPTEPERPSKPSTPNQPDKPENPDKKIGSITASYKLLPRELRFSDDQGSDGSIKKGNIPKTGDDSRPYLVLAIWMFSGVFLVGTWWKKRKRRKMNPFIWCTLLMAITAFLWSMAGTMTSHAQEINHSEVSEERFITITTPVYDNALDLPVPELSYVSEEDGLLYELEAQREIVTEIPGYWKRIDQTHVFDAVEQGERLPEEAAYERADGQQGMLSLLSADYENERWEDGFEFTAMFWQYDSQEYIMGNSEITVPRNDISPPLDGQEELLLHMIGVNAEDYRILGARWQGDALAQEQGIWCREALIYGEKKVWDCKASYGGDIWIPERKVYAMELSYRYRPGEIIDIPTEEPVIARQKITLIEPSLQETSDADMITNEIKIDFPVMEAVMAGAAILLFLLLLSILIYDWGMRKRKRKPCNSNRREGTDAS